MEAPQEIIPNLYKLPAIKPSAHSYLIIGEKNTLVDIGTRENFSMLKEQLNILNLKISSINDIIFTHCHYDHTGAGEFFPNAVVYAHPFCQSKIRYQDESSIHALKYGVELPENIPSMILKDGDIYQNGNFVFKIIYTPGHSDDSICLYELESQILISGDTIFASGIPPLITHSGSDATLINSIEKLMNFSITTILPGHGRIDQQGLETLIKTKNNIINRIQILNKKIRSGDAV